MDTFIATAANHRNRHVEKLFRTLFLMMTLLLILPVAIILGTMIWEGAPAISWEPLSASAIPCSACSRCTKR